MATGGAASAGARKRARVPPDYVMDIRVGPDGERTQQPHYLTERCDCMPGVRVPDDVGYSCRGARRARHWHWLQGYASLGGRFRDDIYPNTESGMTLASRYLWSQREVVRPCEYHARALGLFREYIETTAYTVSQRQTLQNEIDTLNQGIKDGLGEHVSRHDYKPIPHRHEWEEDQQEDTEESALEKRVRELEEENWHLRTDMLELSRQPDTREVATQTDPLGGP